MSAALFIDILLWGSVAAVGFIAYQRGRLVLTSSLRQGTMDFINIVPRIALGVIGSGYTPRSSRRKSSPAGSGPTRAGLASSPP